MTELYFQYPQAFLLFLILPVFLSLRKKTREKVPFTYVRDALERCQPSLGRRYYDSIIYCFAFLFLVFALVNVGYSQKSKKQFIESKWIILCLDISGSMKRAIRSNSDISLEDLALYGADKFIEMRGEKDSIGIMVFSSEAKLLAPLTFDKKLLKEKLSILENKSRFYRELSAGAGTNAPEAVWRSLTVFFSMLPQKSRLNINEIANLKNYLSGSTSEVLNIPEKLKDIGFGTGMSVIIFTDGRIAPSERVHGGETPNFFNTIKLMSKLGVKLYIISVGAEIDEAVREAMQSSGGIGKIFITSKQLDKETIKDIYSEINKLESNRILSKVTVKKEWTREWFMFLALLLMIIHFVIQSVPKFRKI